MKYTAVIAAAGLSSRMKEFKPMLCIEDQTMISSVITGFWEAGVDRIVVVTGYRSETLEKYLRTLHGEIEIVYNEEYASTKMFDSICLGIRQVDPDVDGIFVTPGDVPLVKSETIRQMMETAADVVRPTFSGRRGHPILFRRSVIDEILSHDGEKGLKGALDKIEMSHAYTVCDLSVEDEGIHLDADTPEDLKILRKYAMETRSGGKLWPEVSVNISRSSEIFTPFTAQFLEMIDHTGSIRTACGCLHMSYTKGWTLLNRMEEELGYPLINRNPGGSGGGGSTLTNRGKKLLIAYRDYRSRLQKVAVELFYESFPEDLL